MHSSGILSLSKTEVKSPLPSLLGISLSPQICRVDQLLCPDMCETSWFTHFSPSVLWWIFFIHQLLKILLPSSWDSLSELILLINYMCAFAAETHKWITLLLYCQGCWLIIGGLSWHVGWTPFMCLSFSLFCIRLATHHLWYSLFPYGQIHHLLEMSSCGRNFEKEKKKKLQWVNIILETKHT